MKNHILSTAAAASFLAAASLSAQTTIQFGGDATHLTDGTTTEDINWNAAVGADQIIQWNGVNSNGGTFEASGTLAGQGVNATLTSLGTENVVLTTRALSAVDVTGIQTASTGLPQVLGVDSGTDAVPTQFEAEFNETWTFDFSQDVTLTNMIGVGMGFDGERFGIDIGADGTYEFEWNRTGFTVGSGLVTASVFGGSQEYLATFDTGVISAGTDITIAGLQGVIGLQALVVVIPEPSSFAMLIGASALGLVLFRRRG